jgi:Cft2 family RNA processing exonuclease
MVISVPGRFLTQVAFIRKIPDVKKLDTITFTPCGGGREIGANAYLVRVAGYDILMDCGIHPKKEGACALPEFRLLRRAPDAVIVSHGHVDHCGALPQLLKQFPGTVPYATEATVRVIDRMLHNSVAVMSTIAREREIADYPLYDHEDVDFAVNRTEGMPLDQEFGLNGDGSITASFRHAGHVLGSASVLLRTPRHTLFYTGDICAADQELMAGLSPLDDITDVDTLIIESTYGANEEADNARYDEQSLRFGAALGEVLGRGGCVLVPSFALGRTQEMLTIIARLQDSGMVPNVPVYASGLGRAIYEVYHRYPGYLHPDASLRPLSRFGRVGDVWDREVTLELLRRPSVIVATSGMMIENTPSALIAEEMVGRRKHGIFFVGYLDPETLGYKLLHAEKGARLAFGLDRPRVKVTLEDIRWFHFSAHAPREVLREIVTRIDPKNVVFVHGDPEAIDWMHAATNHGYATFSATVGQTLTLEA